MGFRYSLFVFRIGCVECRWGHFTKQSEEPFDELAEVGEAGVHRCRPGHAQGTKDNDVETMHCNTTMGRDSVVQERTLIE